MNQEIPDKLEAWEESEWQKSIPSIPIDYTLHSFRFRKGWFRLRNQRTFSLYLVNRYPSNKPINVLTIGVFEAMAETWLLQNIACHPDSRIVSMDPWQATGKLDQDYMDECFKNAQHNLFPWKDQVTLLRGFSQDILPRAVEEGSLAGIAAKQFDLLYIDGNHEAEPVYQDALNCLMLARSGAWMVFDDVRNNRRKNEHVKEGLLNFLEDYGDRVRHAWSHRFCECYEVL